MTSERINDCAPQAISKLTGIDAARARARLSAAERDLGLASSLDGYVAKAAVAVVLRDLGFRAERWSTGPRGWRLEQVHVTSQADLSELFEILTQVGEINARHASASPVPFAVQRAHLAAGVVRGERAHRRYVRPLSPRDWIRRFGIGSWLLFVHGHVISAHAGAILSGGGDAFETRPLADVWRLLRRR